MDRHEQGMAVGEKAHQAVGDQQGEAHIGPATACVAGAKLGGSQPACLNLLGQAVQGGHIAPAEIEPLPAYRMAAVGRFAKENGAVPMHVVGQEKAHGKGLGRLLQPFHIHPRGQHRGQGIEKSRRRELFQLAAAPGWGAPDHLKPIPAHGKEGKGAFRPEPLPGHGGWGSP